MQDALTDSIRLLRARVDELLASRVLSERYDAAAMIGRALSIEASADEVVRAVVLQARDQGATWQTIGDALGVSRQAAFQRYGKPIDPRTGEPMNTTPLAGADDLARSIIDDLVAGRWAQITERFDPIMRDSLPEDALAAAWAQIVGTSGAFEGRGDPDVTRAGDLTITSTPLSMEAGDYTARIALRDDRTIAGLHILEKPTS